MSGSRAAACRAHGFGRANELVVHIPDEGPSALFLSGNYRDRIVVEGGAPCFCERLVLLDSKSIETLFAIPL